MAERHGATAHVRNLVLLNAAPDALGYTAIRLGRNARVIRVEECGPAHLAVAARLPSLPEAHMLLPRHVCFGASTEELAPLLHGLRSPRLLVAQSVIRPDRLETLHRLANFDAVILGEWVDAEHARDALTGMAPHPEAGIDGLRGARFFAAGGGVRALDAALSELDAESRRQQRLREQVYEVTDLVLFDGFYDVERDREWAWAWSGPGSVATILVPGHGAGTMQFTLFFFASKFPIDASHLRVLVNGAEMRSVYFPQESKVEVTGLCPATLCNRIDLVQTEMVPTADHSRFIGLALHKLKVEAQQ